MKINAVDDVWKSGEKVEYIKPDFTLVCSQNTGSFVKHVLTVLVLKWTSSDFKTPRNLVKSTRLLLAFSIPLGVWKLEEFLILC